ncbi:hypothetical protein [Vibrio alginolyticus]|uniref:hypothetical protein n=1 Tax=Vibrio alginolyticus TaxID=663 RepID=UPI0006CA6B26|nr:hypothetical protein [Vibrio alginolyticus]KPM98415.1 hypothetical protein AOG25_08190 [Vibrio alginolyticus]CAH7134601.1 conserved hypothetical protein [Vibrio chagasii]
MSFNVTELQKLTAQLEELGFKCNEGKSPADALSAYAKVLGADNTSGSSHMVYLYNFESDLQLHLQCNEAFFVDDEVAHIIATTIYEPKWQKVGGGKYVNADKLLNFVQKRLNAHK